MRKQYLQTTPHLCLSVCLSVEDIFTEKSKRCVFVKGRRIKVEMLDLNVSAVSVNSNCDEHDPHNTLFFKDDSVTSNTACSSVAGDEDSNSSSHHGSKRSHYSLSTLNFSILKGDRAFEIEDESSGDMLTRQLFPVKDEQGTRIQGQSQKKSRHGPRSRSSQYRGVTFYRRTGRWESHIWLHIIIICTKHIN